MKATPHATLSELVLFEPRLLADERGTFRELWHAERYAALGLDAAFVQDNVSTSRRGVLRGLHVQHPRAQGKLVTVVAGAAFDVAVDVRVGSPTFGRWAGFELTAANAHQLWIPPGFAHGFLVLADDTVFTYKCTDVYSPADEFTVRWDDPAVGIAWPVREPALSPKDAAAPTLAELHDRLPRYEPVATGA